MSMRPPQTSLEIATPNIQQLLSDEFNTATEDPLGVFCFKATPQHISAWEDAAALGRDPKRHFLSFAVVGSRRGAHEPETTIAMVSPNVLAKKADGEEMRVMRIAALGLLGDRAERGKIERGTGRSQPGLACAYVALKAVMLPPEGTTDAERQAFEAAIKAAAQEPTGIYAIGSRLPLSHFQPRQGWVGVAMTRKNGLIVPEAHTLDPFHPESKETALA